MQNVIVICGMNGAGKSTLAKALADEMGYRFLDIEDIYFPKTDPAYIYANPRSLTEVEEILLNTIAQRDTFVLASVRGKFREDIVSHFKCVVHLEAPKEIRLKRVYARAYAKFGDRMCEGGDLYEKEQVFFNFVRSREENTVRDWLATVSCPIITLDGTLPIAENVQWLGEKLREERRLV